MKLSTRMKGYEEVAFGKLTRKTPVIIRVDGKAFHTFTKGMERPFDRVLIEAMVRTAEQVASEISSFKLGYQQSDEVTFLLTDDDKDQTEPWFNNEIQKLASVVASMFTAYFNTEIKTKTDQLAFFDARAFNVPQEEVPNNFIWRQRDWERNSLQMVALSLYSHKELKGKKRTDLHEMLYRKGINWAKLDPDLKNGTFITRKGERISEKFDYEGLTRLIQAQY